VKGFDPQPEGLGVFAYLITGGTLAMAVWRLKICREAIPAFPAPPLARAIRPGPEVHTCGDAIGALRFEVPDVCRCTQPLSDVLGDTVSAMALYADVAEQMVGP
jgi:hypothetical protein